MKILTAKSDGSIPSVTEIRNMIEMCSSTETGLWVKFEDGRISNVRRKQNETILLTPDPFVEFKDENELNLYLCEKAKY